MTADQVQAGRFILLPSGRPVEIVRRVGEACECRYLGTQDYCDLRVDWVRRYCKPYAVNQRGGK
jgi:hypothetical protein